MSAFADTGVPGAVDTAGRKRPKVLDVAGLDPAAARYSRTFDFMILACVVFLFAGAISFHVLLTVGDWDLFIDWKDRQYWLLASPISMIMFPAALQAIFWTGFRLPIGATVGAVLLFVATWAARYLNWHLWAYFPIPMSIPGQMITSAILLDVTLLIVRNGFFTSCFGAFLFGLVFFPANYTALAPYYLPVEHQGMMASVADMIGYVFPRSATPEYIRIIEHGTLRTFGNSVAWVSAVFSGFICIFVHFVWWHMGQWTMTSRFLPNSNAITSWMGVKAKNA
jgi:methane/ammonia monooxygenase subunit A